MLRNLLLAATIGAMTEAATAQLQSCWQVSVVDDTPGAGFGSTLAFDAEGYPAMSYIVRGDIKALRYAHFDGSHWNLETIDAGSEYSFSVLKFNTSGTAVVGYYDGTDDTVRLAERVGNVWQIEDVTSGEIDSVSSQIGLVFDSEQLPLISFNKSSGTSQTWVTEFDGEMWNETFIDSGTLSGWWSSLVILPDNTEVLGYTENYSYYIRLRNGQQWVLDESFSGEAGMANFGLTVNPLGQPSISYMQFSSGRLRFAERNANGQWSDDVVDQGDVFLGANSSCTYDLLDAPAISYTSFTTPDELRVARKDLEKESWFIETVHVANNDNILETSIGVAPDGSIGVSFGDGDYFDEAFSQLLFAYYSADDSDCNLNSIVDSCDIADGTSLDCNNNQVPDECDLSDPSSADCNNNFIPDDCDLQVTFPAEFADLQTFSAGIAPFAIAALDVDADDAVDVAVTNFGPSDVSVVLNHGIDSDGQWLGFGKATSIDVGQFPTDLAFADLDGDGDPDLATSNLGSDSVSILENDGAGGYALVDTVDVGLSPWSIIAADLDGDGDADLATANFESDDVTLLLNDSTGQFVTVTIASVGEGPKAIEQADFDADNDIDLVVANSEADSIVILVNDGSGGFNIQSEWVVGDAPIKLEVDDFNADGWFDVIVLNQDSNSFWVLLSDGEGGFITAQVVGTALDPQAIDAADLDGDADADLVLVATSTTQVDVWLNDGEGHFAPGSSADLVGAGLELVAVTLDSDPYPDMTVIAGTLLNVMTNETVDAVEEDCNLNAVPDSCDIMDGTSDDTNDDGLPDECQGCDGDANGDGIVDPLDSGFVLSRLGCSVGTGDANCDSADQNGDGVVDPLDVGFVLSRLGACI